MQGPPAAHGYTCFPARLPHPGHSQSQLSQYAWESDLNLSSDRGHCDSWRHHLHLSHGYGMLLNNILSGSKRLKCCSIVRRPWPSLFSFCFLWPQLSENIKWKIPYIIHSKLLIASALRSVKKSCIPLLCPAWDQTHALVQHVCLCMAVLVRISTPVVLHWCVQAAFALFSNSPAAAAFLISRIK